MGVSAGGPSALQFALRFPDRTRALVLLVPAVYTPRPDGAAPVRAPRATMFMGDVGSIPLGFLAASFGIAGAVTGLWPAWFPVLVFLPFIADATATLARRISRGDRLSAAHRDHYYQRLNRLGAGHTGTLSLYAVLMAGTCATALGCLLAAPAWGMVALGLWCVVCSIVFAAIDYHWRKSLPDSP